MTKKTKAKVSTTNKIKNTAKSKKASQHPSTKNKSKQSSSKKPVKQANKLKRTLSKIKTLNKKKPIIKTKAKTSTKNKKPVTASRTKKLATGSTRKIVIAKTPGKMLKKTTKQKPIVKTTKKQSQPQKTYTPKAGEDYMNAAQLEHFKKLLLQWKEELLREAEVTVQDMQASSANFPDPVDRASQEEEFNLELRTRDRERKLLKKIEEALQRIKENNFGYCDDCGSEIGAKRLEARPTATQCIECKTIAEIREKQIGEIGKEKEEE